VGNKLQKKVPESLKENTQYVMAFGLIATMLLVAGFPMFVIFFFAIFAYFLWKTFSQPSRTGTREIFEFYLSANEFCATTNAVGSVLKCRKLSIAASAFCK
jgi:flagellar biosynthesis component FlhA